MAEIFSRVCWLVLRVTFFLNFEYDKNINVHDVTTQAIAFLTVQLLLSSVLLLLRLNYLSHSVFIDGTRVGWVPSRLSEY